MAKLFNKIRQKLVSEKPSVNRTTNYLKYAIGEVVLVVIGILIAVSINTWNNNRNDRTKEIKYLKAIKQDLLKDIENTTYNIAFRKKKLLGIQKIINQMNGQEIDNLTELGINIGNSLYVERFQPNNITFKEMVSSGNVYLISNDSVKTQLLELELLYQKNIFGIEHETFEYQEYISKPIFNDFNIQTVKQLYTNTKTAEELNLKNENFKALLQNRNYLNGCVISNWTSEEMIVLLGNIENKSKKTIAFINNEIKKQ